MKILFEIVADQSQAAIQLAKLRESIRTFRSELRKDGVGADRVKELNNEILKTTVQVGKLTEQQKNLNREFKAASVPKDSLVGLRIEYAKITDQVSKLDKASRQSQFGQNLIKQGAGLKAQIDGIEESLGRFTGNVGNYRKALLSVGDIVTGGLATGGIVVGVQAVIGVMKLGVDQAIKYEKALDDLSALTGLTGASLAGLEEVGKGLRNIQINGVEIVSTGPEILNALKLVGGARPELLKDAEALGAVTREAIILSQASGDALEPSVKALTTIMGQFNLSAADARRVINELAAGAKEGAAEIPQITDSLREFGTVAKISNVSTSESIALIEVLADRQLKGAEAGTQLRNVLSKLASADILPKSAQKQFEKLGIDINVLKDATLPFETRLRELGKAQGDLSALTKIFGLENLQAATIITSGLDKYEKLTVAVQGTNEAYLQAEIRSQNLSTQLENLKSKGLNSLQEQFEGATASGGQLVGIIGSLVEGFDLFGKKINIVALVSDLALGPLSQVLERINAFTNFFKKDDKPKGLQGLDLDELKSSVDLLTGEVKPAIDDTTDALLKQANALIEAGKAADESEKSDEKKGKSTKKLKDEVVLVNGSIAFFEKQIQDLKKTLDNTPTESPLFNKLQKNIRDAELALLDLKEKLKTGLDPKDLDTTSLPSAQKGIVVPVTLEVQNEDETAKQLEDFAKRTAKEAADIKAKAKVEEDEKDAKRRDDVEDAIKEAALNTAQAIADGVFEIQRNKNEKEKEERLKLLDEETKRRIENAQGNSVLISKIEKDADKKRAAIEKEAAQRAKQIALKEAAINTALAVLKALSSAAPPFNFILAAAVAVAGAIQLGVINSQKYGRGGVVKNGQPGQLGGKPHSQGGTKGVFDDGTRVEMEVDEMLVVINRRNSQMLSKLSALNSAGGNGIKFAQGGTLTTNLVSPQQRRAVNNARPFAQGGFLALSPQLAQPGPSSSSNSQPVQVEAMMSDEQMLRFARIVATETAASTGGAVANGLNDADRTNERKAILNQTRQR